MNKRDIQLSKSLSWLLRHGAYKEGLRLSTDGYLAVDKILQHKNFKGKYDESDIQRVVNNNDKQRFKLKWNIETNSLEIKANQGHTIEVDDSDLIPILEPIYQTVVHGTYYNCWPKIKTEGLSCMKRRHIHLSKATLDTKVISGIRNNAQIYIFIDLEKGLREGIKFYESVNGVILTTGNQAGFLPPKYFIKVTDVKTGFPMFTQPQDLERIFSEYGVVNVDRLTKRYATLSFDNEDHAKNAIKNSMKITLYGDIIVVKPYYNAVRLPEAITPKKEQNLQYKKGRTILSPNEIQLSGGFREQLENILMAIRLTQEEVQQISKLYMDLEGVLQVAWPGCTAIPFGSITTGLGVKCSDADCFIKIPTEHRYPSNYIMKAKRILQLHKSLFSDIVPIPHANTPIIKLYHMPSKTYCDLTFKTLLGTRNSKLVDFLLHADSRLLPMAILVRYWALVHGFSGTRKLTNYALTMMLVFYVQQAPVSILPSIEWLQKDPTDNCIIDGWDAGFMNDYGRLPPSADTSSEAELLGGFFQYYSTFDFSLSVVCPYLGHPLKKMDFANTSQLPASLERYTRNIEKGFALPLKFTTPVCIQDPFEHSHNIASAISGKMLADLQMLFKFAASAFEMDKINGSPTFLRTILLQKPKKFGIKYAVEYRTNISQRDLACIKSPGWKAVIEHILELIFGHILGFTLIKSETKATESQKEKLIFRAKATKAVWRRKYSSRPHYLRPSDFLERQKSLTAEVVKIDKEKFELNFQLELLFNDEPRRLKIALKMLNGDKDLFWEFGKFFHSVINWWFKILLQPHFKTAPEAAATRDSQPSADPPTLPHVDDTVAAT